MTKALIICGKYPLPEDHGSPMRTMNFVRYFLKQGRVDVAYSGPPAGEHEGKRIFTKAYRLKQNEALPGAGEGRLNRLLQVRHIPLPVRPFDRNSEKFLLSVIEMEDYDYILVRYVVNSSILFKLPEKYRKRTMLDFDDVLSVSLYESKFGSLRPLHKRAFAELNRRFLLNYERNCLKFGAALFCSDKDRNRFACEGKSNLQVVQNVYVNKSFESFDFGEGFERGNTLLFVGSLRYGPNTQGLKWFINEVFPGFRERYAYGRLLVVGRAPDDEIRRLCAGAAGVELYADAPDIREYYRKCRAVVVPLLAGGGTRIKILEAALAERPVLSTPIGAEGLDLGAGREVLLFDGVSDFIAEYSKLRDYARYSGISRNAKETVNSRYSTATFNAAMDGVLNGMSMMTAGAGGQGPA